MGFTSSDASGSSNNTVAGYNSNTSYNNSSSGSGILAYVIGLVGFILILVALICFWQLRYSNYPLQLEVHTLQSNSPLEDEKSRKHYIASNLPCRDLPDDDDDDDDDTSSAPHRCDNNDQDTDPGIQIKDQGRHNNLTAMASPAESCTDDLESLDSSTRVPSKQRQRRKQPRQPKSLCSICLGHYHPGDQIAWSTNPSCSHEYHRECIQGWLLKHLDCPICRHVFLPTPVSLPSHLTITTQPETRRSFMNLRPVIAEAVTRSFSFYQHHPSSAQQQQQPHDLERADNDEHHQPIDIEQQRSDEGNQQLRDGQQHQPIDGERQQPFDARE